MRILRTATCQFSVEPSIHHNEDCIVEQIEFAARNGADVVHFSECALSGYAGVDIPDSKSIEWDVLTAATRRIQSKARDHQIWVLLGSTHQLTGNNKPHNSVYVINPKGKIVDRYDKRFCTGRGGRRPTMDLHYYSPGDHFTTFTIKRVKCAILICYDYRFPELYRELKKLGVEVIFQSFHNARKTVVDDDEYNIWKTIVPATMSCRAAENHFWVSANNSATRPSRWGSFAVRPDGAIVDQLKVHKKSILITEMTMDPSFFDAPGPWREGAMNGKLNSGVTVNDPRSSDVSCL